MKQGRNWLFIHLSPEVRGDCRFSLSFRSFKAGKLEGGLDQVIAEARENQVKHMLCVGIDMNNAADVKAIASRYEGVYASVGVHPLDIENAATEEQLLEEADHEKVVAIGETGLDYYYSKDSMDVQKDSLIMHLKIAKQLKLPVIIHTRDAKEDTLAILEEHACKESVGVLHCFTEDWDMAQRAMEMGFYISFSGIVTFKNAKELQEVALKMPLDRMLVETDSPYLTPTPYRGKPNYPKYTRQVAEFIAELRGLSVEAVAEQTTRNFFKLFSKAIEI